MKKYVDVYLWIAGLVLSIIELIRYQSTGCVHTFRNSIDCNLISAIAYVAIALASLVGIFLSYKKSK